MIKLRDYFRSDFSNNFVTMMTGTALAQAIPVISSVFLVRFYSPDMFGAFSSFVSLTGILAILATLKFEEAIVLPDKDEDAKALFQLSLLLNFSFFFLVSIFLFFLKSYFERNFPVIYSYIFLIPFGVFFIGFYQSLSFLSSREKKFKKISLSKVTQNLFTAIFQLGLYEFLLRGLLFGRIAGFFISSLHFINYFRANNFFKINKLKIKSVFLTYKNFALYYTPNTLLNQVSNNLPLFMLPAFFGLSHAGYYSFSTRLVLVPLSIVTISLQQVFYKEIADRNNAKLDLYPYLLRMYKNLAIFAVIPHLILFLFAPNLFVFFFGEEWLIAGHYTQYLMPWFFLVFLNSPVSSIYIVKGKQKEYFLFEIILLISRALSLWFGHYFFKEPSRTIILYGLVGLIFNAFLVWYYLRISKIQSF
jgi:lipopolysaccharide exporter